jgi:glucose/arabinose dehydrogenase
MTSASRRRSLAAFAVAAAVVAATSATGRGTPRAGAAAFQSQTVFSGLTHPVSIAFASDGRVFVAEARGLIKVFDSLTDATPTVFADLRKQVYGHSGHGLLGLALDPSFPGKPYVYAAFDRDSTTPGGPVPAWNDRCPNPPGRSDGCVTYGRVVRLTANGDHMSGTPRVLVDEWCAQFTSHTIDTLRFGPDGNLYVSGGDGADFPGVDYGQHGYPTTNPCHDPPGGTVTPPTAQGGSLRAQDVRTNDDPAGLDGTVIRIDPSTGAGAAGNPFAGSSDVDKQRVLAYGLRNAFRFTFKPGSDELWIADNGTDLYDEINRVANVTTGVAPNFGWPCYEGSTPQPSWKAAGFNLCTSLYSAGTATAPAFQYAHSAPLFTGDPCPTGSGSPDGLAFYTGSSYPASYKGALFFADWARQCIYVVPTGANGEPAFGQIRLFMNVAPAGVTDLEAGPGGDLFYVDNSGGTVVRIRFA